MALGSGGEIVVTTATKLGDGRWATIAAIEVLRIPDFSVVQDHFADRDDVNAALRDEFALLLGELAQLGADRPDASVAIELVWRGEAVVGQPYAADIRTFVTMRSLSFDAQVGANLCADAISVCQSALSASGFVTVALADDAIATIYADTSATNVVAVHKRGRNVPLHIAAMPNVFSFDRLPEQTIAFNHVFDALTDAPGAMVSVQLLVDRFSPEERAYLSGMSLKLGTLAAGVNEAGSTVTFAIARQPADVYAHYSDRSAAPMFAHQILVAGTDEQTRVIASRVIGTLTNSEVDAPVDVARVPLAPQNIAFDQDVTAVPWRVAAALESEAAVFLWPGEILPGERRLSKMLTAREASQLFRLPFGNERVGAGFRVNRTMRRSRSYHQGVVDNDIEAGFIGNPESGVPIGFRLGDITKHMFVTGTPGSGKTTFNVGLLDRLWRDHGIPFLVIEPAKNEYRAMIETIPDLQVFTPGKSWLSPLIINPFKPSAGVRLENHKTVLKTAFAAALTMTSPLDRIFESALEGLYADLGWLDADRVDDCHPVPNVRDFVKAFQDTFEAIGYSGDAQNIGRAGLVRLASMVRAFDTYQSIPIYELCNKPTVIELSAIENPSEKTLYIALLLLLLLSHHNANTVGLGSLQQVLLLEEAHVLFEAADASGEGGASPAAIAQNLLKRMLAEIRSYGVGIMVADQSPRKVGLDVIALTNIKVAFRVVEADDRNIIGHSSNMSEAQITRLAGLRTGEAFLFHDRLSEPEEILTVDRRAGQGIAVSISDEELAKRIAPIAPELLLPYPECAFVSWDPARAEVARQFAQRIFRGSLSSKKVTFDDVKPVFRRLRAMAATLDARYPAIDDVLLDMIRVYFLRLVRFETNVRLHTDAIQTILSAPKQQTNITGGTQ